MAILVKGQITITKGFDTWQKMVYEQDGKLEEHGIKFLFAGTEKENPDQLHVVMMFPNMEALQAFGADEELTEKRKEAGAVIESAVMTPISGDYFTKKGGSGPMLNALQHSGAFFMICLSSRLY